MRIVIEIDKARFKDIQRIAEVQLERNHFRTAEQIIANGTPLPKGHGRLIDADRFLKRVEEDRMHECYMHSWTIDDVLQRLDSWYAPTIIEADKERSNKE